MFGFAKRKAAPTVEVFAPFPGELIPLEQVEDEVFASGMVGKGFAMIPSEDSFSATGTLTVGAPVSGTLSKVFKTLHAFAIKTDEGVDILVHIGLDTVELKGAGFTALATAGERVEAGQGIIEVAATSVRDQGFNLATPVVFPDKKKISAVELSTGPMSAAAQAAVVTLSH